MRRLLCVGGQDVPDEFQQATVVEPVDPLQGFPLDFKHRFPWPDLVDSLGFEQANFDFEAQSLSELKSMQKGIVRAIYTFEDRQKPAPGIWATLRPSSSGQR